MNFIENVGDVCIYDCEAFCVKLIRKTERNELIWEDAKKIREKYDVDKLFNSSANGIFKYKTLFMNTQVIFIFGMLAAYIYIIFYNKVILFLPELLN